MAGINPFKKAASPITSADIIQPNSRAGGEFEAAMAKKIFGVRLHRSPKNKHVRHNIRLFLASKKTFK